MGYACPVCEDPQADGRHLANHLAFTAILGDADHEAWLDDHAGDWGEMSEHDLAAVVADEVEETSFPQVFEDTVGGLEEPGESPAERSGALFDDGHHDHGDSVGTPGRPADGPRDEETAAILEEAREMTREMLDESERGVEADEGEGAVEESERDAGSDEDDSVSDDGDADNNE